MAKGRPIHPGIKAKAALQAIKGDQTVNVIAANLGVHPTQVSTWKKQLIDEAALVFEDKRGRKQQTPDETEFYEQIGRLKMELEWLKKSSPSDHQTPRLLVDPDHPQLSLRRQCELLGIHRSGLYYQAVPALSDEDQELMRLIDREYTRHPFYGSRRMQVYLRSPGHVVNRKHIQRLQREMGIQAIYPRPRTSVDDNDHRRYPYLLKGYQIRRPNEVWSADITYIPMYRGVMYLVAVIDWYSRAVIAHRLSTTMDVSFCLDGLEAALSRGRPEIFNTDQGSQFTSSEFTDRLQRAGIRIRMDGRGRCHDNIFIERLWRSLKYEEIYLREYSDGASLRAGIAAYFTFYNEERPHQALNYRTPMQVHLDRVL